MCTIIIHRNAKIRGTNAENVYTEYNVRSEPKKEHLPKVRDIKLEKKTILAWTEAAISRLLGIFRLKQVGRPLGRPS
jgi:hypothetical protein